MLSIFFGSENAEEEGGGGLGIRITILPGEVTQFKKISEAEDRTSLLFQQVDPSEFPGKKKKGYLLTV